MLCKYRERERVYHHQVPNNDARIPFIYFLSTNQMMGANELGSIQILSVYFGTRDTYMYCICCNLGDDINISWFKDSITQRKIFHRKNNLRAKL